MKQFIIHDSQGKILRTGSCPDDHMEQQALPGETVIEGKADDVLEYINGGHVTAFPSRPSPKHEFDFVLKQWFDPRTLADLKAAQWATIKQARDAAELGPFTYNAMVFDGDLNAQRRLAAYISVSKSAIAAGQPFSAEFTLADNTLVMLSAQDFVGIELAKVQSVAAAFAHATALRAQIEAAATAEEVALITW